MNIWKPIYRALVDVRNALDVLIRFARTRAFPKNTHTAGAEPAKEPL